MSAISEHFTWAEATRTDQPLPNIPDPEASAALVHTFQRLESVRALFGKPLVVHSAYRSPAVNAAVGGAATSQHMKGEAVDFHIQGLTVGEVFDTIRQSKLSFDQLIEEAATWVHISFSHGPRPERHQSLRMRVVEGKAHYEPVA